MTSIPAKRCNDSADTRTIGCSGAGLVWAGAGSVDGTWDALLRNESTPSPRRLRFGSRPRFPVGSVPKEYGPDSLLESYLPAARFGPGMWMVESVVSQASAQAELAGRYAPERIGVYIGTCSGLWRDQGAGPLDGEGAFGPIEFLPYAAMAAACSGSTGPQSVVSVACSAGIHALGPAYEDLVDGLIDAAVWVGVDQLLDFTGAAFAAVGSMDGDACSPYGRSGGLNLGEVAACSVIERFTPGDARMLFAIEGYGLSVDAHSPMKPDPSGAGVEAALRRSLARSDRQVSEIDVVCGHGTGTSANDEMESAMFDRLDLPRVFGLKGATGHAFGGSSAMEVIVAGLAVRNGLVPPSQGISSASSPRIVVKPGRLPTDPCAASISSAFGGHNGSVIVSGGRAETSRPSRSQRDVFLRIGHSRLLGDDVDATCDTEQPERCSPRQWRRLDRFSQMVVASVADTVRNDSELLHDLAEDDVAYLLATAQSSIDTAVSINRRANEGERWAPSEFGNAVACGAVGAVAIALGWTGPTNLFLAQERAFHDALRFGAQLVGRGEVEATVVTAADLPYTHPELQALEIALAPFGVMSFVLSSSSEGSGVPVCIDQDGTGPCGPALTRRSPVAAAERLASALTTDQTATDTMKVRLSVRHGSAVV